ncbi:MAG: sulfurtransferase TusA family protein [Nitrospinota bacterium]|nr:sulfurtransferase TusA family protein [Nitrospinota bacterium]
MSSGVIIENSAALAAIENFEKAVAGYLGGALPAENFKAARVEMGVYAQRQKDYYMLRTRLAGGLVSAEALEKYAELAETLPSKTVHLTTRQDIQLHFVRIEQAAGLMSKLAEAGVTSSGAGGNTIRNITACVHPGRRSLSGLAQALNQYFTGHELSRGLPRKFKISLCDKPGCYSGLTDDLAFVAARQGQGHGLVFDIYAGGGQGAAPKLGALLERSFPASRINAVILAALKVFNAHGTRKNRARARLKFLIERIGFAEFERLYRQELSALTDLAPLQLDLNAEDILPPSDGAGQLLIKVPGGDLSCGQLRAIAAILRDFAPMVAQVTKNGDLLLTGAKELGWGRVSARIEELGLAAGEHMNQSEVATCNGSVTCSEGITNSRGLSLRLERIAAEKQGPPVSIRVSGCPNACSGHHTADIGLQGSARRVNGVLIPHYVVSLGGASQGQARLAAAIGRIPARNAPEAVGELLELISHHAGAGESAAQVITRLGEEVFETTLKRYEAVKPELSDYRKDFDTETDFNVDEVGPGECAGSALDVIDGYFDQARRELHAAEKDPLGELAQSQAYRAAILSARALLVKYGADPATDEATVEAFRSVVVAGDESPTAWNGALEALTLPAGQSQVAPERLSLAKRFFDKCHEAYTLGALPLAAKAPTATETVKMDLSGVACPFNYTKITLRLENLAAGARLEALLDDGAPIRNVPRSLINDGHKIISITPSGGRHLLLVEKSA